MDKFISVLPPASSDIENSLDRVADKIVSLDLSQFDINPKTCNKKLLPFLAAQVSIVLSGLNESEQRALLSNAKHIYKYHGTPYAVEQALNSIFANAQVVEFEERPYIFSAKVMLGNDINQVLGGDKFNTAKRLVEFAKNGRSRFSNFDVSLPDVVLNVNLQGAVQWML